MSKKKLTAAGRQIISGFRQTLKRLGLFILFGAGIGLLGFLITFPLWYFATRYSRGYTAFVLIALLLFILLTLGRRFMHLSKQYGGYQKLFSRRIIPGLGKVLKLLIFLVSLYGIIYLYSRGFYGTAIPLSICYFVLVGYLKYTSGRRTR